MKYAGKQLTEQQAESVLQEALEVCDFKARVKTFDGDTDEEGWSYEDTVAGFMDSCFREVCFVAFRSFNPTGRLRCIARRGDDEISWSVGVTAVEPNEDCEGFEWDNYEAAFGVWQNGFGFVWTEEVLFRKISEAILGKTRGNVTSALR